MSIAAERQGRANPAATNLIVRSARKPAQAGARTLSEVSHALLMLTCFLELQHLDHLRKHFLARS